MEREGCAIKNRTRKTLNSSILTIDGHIAFVFDFAVIVFDNAFVFAMHVGGDVSQNEFMTIAIIHLFEFLALLSDFQAVQIPLDGGSVKRRKTISSTKTHR